MNRTRTLSRIVMSLFFVAAGLNHFRSPGIYLSMMPSYLPRPDALNWIAGAAEIAGGLGALIRSLRVLAGWGLIALLVAVFPANLHVAIHGWPEVRLPHWILWARLPLQPAFIAWVYFSCLGGFKPEARSKSC